MSEATRNRLVVVALVAMAVFLVALVISEPSQQDRVAKLGQSIMCPVCQGESIASSPSQMARDMMSLVEERVADGATDAEIINELLSSYTGALLLDPPVRGPTLVLWLAPAVALLAGIGVIVWWRRQTPADTATEDARPGPTPSRRAVGALILIGSFAAVVMVVGYFLGERDPMPDGVAGIEVEDLSQVSNETMEAVIATNTDSPWIDGMRLALADRYLVAGDYRAAFPHFMAVASSPIAQDREVVTALVGLGWMAWDGNQQDDAAIGLFDQALAIDPASVSARYLKGQVLWCGQQSPGGAALLFESILADDHITETERTVVLRDLDLINQGEACS